MVFIREFDALRGLMALWVVFVHWAAAVDGPAREQLPKLYGDYPVNVFFIISGFVIFLLRDSRPESYPVFLARRALRLFPAYIVVLVVASLLLGDTETVLLRSPDSPFRELLMPLVQLAKTRFWKDFAVHAFLFQGVIPPSILPLGIYTLVSQAWSLTVEWQFYLIAPLVIGTVMLLPRVAAMAGLAAVGLLFVIQPQQVWAGNLAVDFRWFALGMASYLVWCLITKDGWLANLNHLRLAAVASVALSFAALDDYAPVVIWIVVLYSVLAMRDNRAIVERAFCRLLRVAPLAYVGRISYSVYVVHVLVIVMCLSVLDGFEPGTVVRAMLLLALVLVSTFGLSALLHAYVEKPYIEIGRQFGGEKLLALSHPVGAPGSRAD